MSEISGRPRTRSFDVPQSTTGDVKPHKEKKKKRVRDEESTDALVTKDKNASSPHAAAAEPESKPKKKKKTAVATVDDANNEGADDTSAHAKPLSSDSSLRIEADASGNPPVSAFRISARTQAALAARGIAHLFPIQAATFNYVVRNHVTSHQQQLALVMHMCTGVSAVATCHSCTA